MSLDSVCQRTLYGWSIRSSVALLSTMFLVLTGCADHSLNLDEASTAYLSMGVSFPEGASIQLGSVDGWQVQIIRPGAGVVAEDEGPVTPDQQTVTVELSVTLQASCEVLTVLIELSSGGEVWFRSEGPAEVCVGAANGIHAQQLQWVGPSIGLSPTSLSFSLEEGSDPLTQTLTVTNQGGGTLNWTASEDRWWLGIVPTSGSLGSGQSEAIQVTVSDLDLTGGQYQGVISVADPNAINSPSTASVTLDYVQQPRIGLSAEALTFTADEGMDPDPQTLTITNVGGGILKWSASNDVEWLSLSPSAGSLGPGQSHELAVSVSSGALSGGTYQATINVTDPQAANSPQVAAVGLTVIEAPRIGLNPSSLSFTTDWGIDPDPQVLTISNLGGQTLNWTAALDDVDWLGLSALSGSLASGQSQNVAVLPSVGALNPGVYETSITVADPGAVDSPQIVPVTLTVNQGPLIGLSAAMLNIAMLVGEDPSPKVVTISNAGGGLLEWQATDNVPWIRLTPTSGTLGTGLSQSMTIEVNATDLDDGVYPGLITVSGPDAENSPQTIQVNLWVRPRAAPVISDFQGNLVKLNDPTCLNPEGSGSRFRMSFDYSDQNGDLPISGGSFEGNPVEVQSSFPDFYPDTAKTTADVEGDGFGGKAGFDVCIFFYEWSGANIWVTLEDDWGLVSNQLYFFINRPEGANAPSQSPGSQSVPGVPYPASVLIPGRSGG